MAQTSNTKALKALIGVLLAAFVYFIYDGVTERIIVVGDKAPNFKVTTDGGKTMSRGEFGGKVLVLNFWATWCPPCIEELPSLNAFQEELRKEGVVVLGVSVDRNDKAYKQFLSRAGVKFETSRDPEARISANYGTFKFPETYVINQEGKVVEKFIGPENWTNPEVLARIKRLL